MSSTGIEIIDLVTPLTPIPDDFRVEKVIGVVIEVFSKTGTVPVEYVGVTVKGDHPRNDNSLLFRQPQLYIGVVSFKEVGKQIPGIPSACSFPPPL